VDSEFQKAEPANPNMRFLIIDDSVTMRRIIANILVRTGFNEIVHAGNGREALDRLAADEIDVVITDWYMPEMNGLDFVKALRSTPATSHIPIVIVTANAASDDIQHALKLGVSSYILKPFSIETMRDKIAALCAQARPRAAAETPGPEQEPAGAPGPAADVTPLEPAPVVAEPAPVAAATEPEQVPEIVLS
jgi:two-component system, chemotaxis family, chemotaxis protein CheY